MKVMLAAAVMNVDGTTMKNPDGGGATVGECIVRALAAPLENDKALTPDKAAARWKLAQSIYGADEIELTPEQLTEIRSRLPQVYTPMVAGFLCSVLS